MEYTIGKTEEFIMDTGKITICMVKVTINGLMGVSTKEDMSMTKKMVTEYIIIQMVGAIKACGKMENNMEKEYLLVQMVLKEKENGKMVNVFFGWMNKYQNKIEILFCEYTKLLSKIF